jgi:flavin-dependent thymidylate synthase
MSGWTSTTREMTPDRVARIPEFLQMLATGSEGNPHGTPFEKSALHFLVQSDIATHIHLLKHRIGVSVNAESARYKELFKGEDAGIRYHIPDDWPTHLKERLANWSRRSGQQYHEILTELVESGVSRKRAKESARYFLPYNTVIRADVMFNFRSFVHFVQLRAKRGAQDEVHWLADDMVRLVREIPGAPFQHSLMAWGLGDPG